MKMLPFGHRILVKILESETTESGLTKPEGIEAEFMSWAEIVALPEHSLNEFINGLAVGDQVALMHFAKDKVIDLETNEEFLVIEVERDSGIKGQIVAVKHKA